MTITEYRKARGLTMEEFGALIGRSKGHMSEIENTGRCSAKLALAIERATSGQVDAASLNDEIADARKQAA
jgi:transcriptional regulator with XRE-family HTH domain